MGIAVILMPVVSSLVPILSVQTPLTL